MYNSIGRELRRTMILYPKDQKEAVIRKIRTLLSDPNTPSGAFSQLAKEGKIPKATISLWKKEVEADLISKDPVKGTPTHTWSSEAKFPVRTCYCSNEPVATRAISSIKCNFETRA